MPARNKKTSGPANALTVLLSTKSSPLDNLAFRCAIIHPINSIGSDFLLEIWYLCYLRVQSFIVITRKEIPHVVCLPLALMLCLGSHVALAHYT